MFRVVIDTNVILSGLFFGGYHNQVITGVFNHSYKIVLSEEIVYEYKTVIIRHLSKQSKKVSEHIEEQLKIIDILVANSLLIDSNNIASPYCSDPDDIKFLQAAIAGDAEYLISGDRHLLVVGNYSCDTVLKPKDFITTISKNKN